MSEALIPIAGITLPAVIVGTVMTVKHLGRSREMAHRERMEALRMGIAPDVGGHAWRAMTCSAIGAGVPAISFFMAWLANLTTRVHEEAWLAAFVVSLVAVVSGGRLARALFTPPSQGTPGPYVAHANGHHKSQVDPDLYDVVGRRG
jgi:hypothetical protein